MFPKTQSTLETLLRGMELFELPIGHLSLKACAFKFLIVLRLCYSIQFYFNLFSILAVANGLYVY